MLLDGANGEKLLCEEIENGALRLCRVFGSVDTIVLPDEVDGRPIRVIGAYCFAEKGRLTEALIREAMDAGLGDGTNAPEGLLRPLNGNYLREITLPDGMTCMETYAFYNCRRLERLSVGAALTEIHSDAFMNCRALHTLVIRANAGDVTGLPFLLNQLTAELCVEFDGEEQGKVRLLYPEYTESYEEIGPAHIFSLHVEGEGYRARKQFVGGRLDVAGYDTVFEKACNEEQFLTLMKMALDRLEYPYALSEEAKTRYERYIADHEVAVLEQLVQAQDEETLRVLCGQSLISDEAIQAAIVRAVSDGWTRGVAGIIRWRNGYAC
ncbi:MAG: leucine-rich repeat protein [Lachnospiraceae bacterium]|nr:leucine-rich repeat protein [bacterium]MDY5516193.1 leucine-rich repeat protein [Lachnospiraceae bacterium]